MPRSRGAHRLELLRRSALLDSPPEEAFDRLTALARRLTGAPVALISLVDDQRHFVKSAVGLSEPWASRRELPLSHSYCRHVVESASPLAIADARTHPLVRENPAIRDLGAVAYAGVPVVTADGTVLGSLCVVDERERQWTSAETEALGTLAAAAGSLVELRLAFHAACEAQVAHDFALRQIPDALLVVDVDGFIAYANQSMAVLLTRTPEELVGRAFWDVLPDETAQSKFTRMCLLAAAERREIAGEVIVPGLRGWYDVRAVPEPGGGVWLYLRDLTARRIAEEARGHADARFRTLVEAVGVLAFETDLDGRWTELGPGWTAITGFAAADSLGRPFSEFIHPDDRSASLAAFQPLLAERELAVEHELRCRTADGGTRWLRVRARGTTGADGLPTGAHGTLTDITTDRALAARLAHLERHDALTGLANRSAFVERLTELAERAHLGNSAAVLLLDLDDFKSVNAVAGHATGDRVLALVADRLRPVVRGTGMVARLAGDQFAILMPEVSTVEEAALLGERLVSEVAAPYAVGDPPVQLTASVGLAIIDGDPLPDAALRQAETALHRAKAAGKARLERFTPALDAAARERHELAAALRVALERGELHLAYQPIVELEAERPTSVEALLRWHHPERGPISPATFIPVAEDVGLIPALGRWVLREACHAVATLPLPTMGRPLAVSVNVSGRQLAEARFPDDVADALAATGLEPERLVLEVTETALVRDPRQARRVLGELRALGVRIAIDDFGTGYSSLSYLQQLPMDVLKIDRSFVADVTQPAGPSLAFARTIVALGQSLGLRTVAEGIETVTQYEALRAVGCGFGQGYLFARPLALAGLAEWLAARPPHVIRGTDEDVRGRHDV